MKILLVRTKRIPQAITLSDIMFAEPVGLEMIKTNLYINLILNRPTKMLKKYGLKRMTGLTAGSVKSLYKYYKLMRSSKG